MAGPFGQLFRLFYDHFFESDESGAAFETNIYQVQGLLAVPGLFVALFLIPRFMDLSFLPPGPLVDWPLRAHRLFFPAYSFTVICFVTVFEWDMLFPDRRDFLILAAFPIRIRDLFFAKLAALGVFLAAIVLAVNGFSILLLPVFSAYIGQARSAGVPRLTLAQIASTGIAALFAFFAVAAFQGVLVNILSPRMFRRLSTGVRMFGMSASVLCLFLFPVYSVAMKPIALNHPDWLRYFPPYWFVGIYDLLLPNPDTLFATLGSFAIKALGCAIAVFCVAWAVGFARFYRRTLETEDIQSPIISAPFLASWTSSPEERAIYDFSGATLARSVKHKLFLATYLSVGISFGVLFTIVIRNGTLLFSREGLRALPLFVTFFVVSGFRAAFNFPAELSANWIFQISGASLLKAARRATRRRVWVSGLIPTLLLFLPLEMIVWGSPHALFHFAFQFVTGALLTDLLFWGFDKVPFACSYSPGKTNLALLAGVYLYGFTNYAFQLADLESWLDSNPLRAGVFLLMGCFGLTLIWTRSSSAGQVRFDSYEPQLQTLDLS